MINLTTDNLVLTSVNILLIYFIFKVIYALCLLFYKRKRIFKHSEFFSEHLEPKKIIKNYSDELKFYKNLNIEFAANLTVNGRNLYLICLTHLTEYKFLRAYVDVRK